MRYCGWVFGCMYYFERYRRVMIQTSSSSTEKSSNLLNHFELLTLITMILL